MINDYFSFSGPSANIKPMDNLPPTNQQGLDICSTPRAEMNLYALDTFPYEFPGKEIRINFEMTEFTAVCPFSDFPDFPFGENTTVQVSVEPVPGETRTDNNSAEYPVVFTLEPS